MSDVSWRERFRSVITSYGIPFATSLYGTYEQWCAANPNHPACSSKAAMRAFANYWSTRKTAGARPRVQSPPVSGPSVQVPTKLRIGHSIKSEKGAIVLRATDLLSLVSTGTDVSQGVSLFSFQFGPQATQFQGSRFQSFSGLFEKYKVRRLKFHYQPACPTSTPGQLVMAWDNDPADGTAPINASGVRQLLSYRDNVVYSVFEPAGLSVTLDDSIEGYYTSIGTDIRLYSPGTMQMAIVVAPTASFALGSVWVEYEVEFSSPSEQRAGPLESYFISYANASTSITGSGSVYDDIISAGGTAIAYGITTAIDTAGHTGVVLSPGTYLFEVNLLQQTAGTIITVSYITTSVDPGSTATATTDLLNVASPGTINGSLHNRAAIVVTGGRMIIHPSANTGNTFAKVWTRVTAMDANPTSSAGVAQYPF